MQEIEKVLEKVVELTEKYKRELARLTLEHQDEVWKMLSSVDANGQAVATNGTLSNGGGGTPHGPCIADIDDMVPVFASAKTRSIAGSSIASSNGTPKFLLGGPMTPLPSTVTNGSIEGHHREEEGPNVDELIAANETLIMT